MGRAFRSNAVSDVGEDFILLYGVFHRVAEYGCTSDLLYHPACEYGDTIKGLVDAYSIDEIRYTNYREFI